MTIADDKENPKAGKKPVKPLDAIAALRQAMEQRLAENARMAAQTQTRQQKAESQAQPQSAPPVPDMAAAVDAIPPDEYSKVGPEPQKEQPSSTNSTQSQPQLEAQQWSSIFFKIAERNQRLFQDFLVRHKDMKFGVPASDPAHLGEAFMMLSSRLLNDPERYADAQITLWQGYIKIWQSSLARMQGQATDPLISPAPSDKRFQDKEWQNNWLFDFMKQSYLLTAKWTQLLVQQETQDVDPKLARKLDFYTRQMVDAVSPSNFWLTNPEVLRTTLASGGENLVKGFENLLGDLERGHGQLRIKMSDAQAFKVGAPAEGAPAANCLATTPGQVVFQNDLIQLIQYEPTTPTVRKTPIMIMSPWINKFYILDLSPKKSFVRHLVAEGHTVFCISWVNPDTKLANTGFDDYMTDGAIAGMREVKRITGEDNINMVGYCIGGTLLASTLAYLNAIPEKPRDLPTIASATYLVTMIDFSEPGDLGVFIDEDQITAIEERMAEQGYLDASSMATTFNLLRSNDLIWSFVINNYLLGKEPFPFDILYWNADSTNLPAEMHSFYLREMYLHNRLVQPGALSMKNVPIDVRTITTPSFMLSTSEDHIAPWRSTYAATQIYKGPVKFVLSGSGHIAGIINPPAANKYSYWTNDSLPVSPDEWLQQATPHQGSWWPEWLIWLDGHAGERVAARNVRHGIEAAPGSYVRVTA